MLASNKHGVYCVPRRALHRPAARAIRQFRVWEPETLDLLRETDPDGDIVHAGTFFGDFLPALARSRTTGAVVWAFEPSRENYRCAQVTIMLNDLVNVELTNAALDGKPGTALLATSSREGLALGGGSRIMTDVRDAAVVSNEEVAVVSIDRAVGEGRHVAVIQLDVEGHEQKTLQGAMLTVERCRPMLVLETPPEASWLTTMLGPLGYEVDAQVHSNVVLRCR